MEHPETPLPVQQDFTVKTAELDELLVLTEQSEFDNFTAKWTLYHYLLQRRTGTAHNEAISNAELAAYDQQTRPIPNAVVQIG